MTLPILIGVAILGAFVIAGLYASRAARESADKKPKPDGSGADGPNDAGSGGDGGGDGSGD